MTSIDLTMLSGIMGSVSIACWIVVFSPQIIENFRRSSADGLSVTFIFIWLIGDVFNILGSVLQRVLPTMIILAVYYTLADIVLLLQCFYYRGFTLRDAVPEPHQPAPSANGTSTRADERTALLNNHTPSSPTPQPNPTGTGDLFSFPRRPSSSASFRARLESEPHHLSPANPLHAKHTTTTPSPIQSTLLRTVAVNAAAVALTIAAGVLGWFLSTRRNGPAAAPGIPTVNIPGQVFGYICTLLYLASRLPQIVLNFRRRSTEGISMLFFIFACLGNLTYVLSIFAYAAPCPEGHGGHHGKHAGECTGADKRGVYGWYILVNLSWLVGSAGTLVLDGFVFVQYFLYRGRAECAIE